MSNHYKYSPVENEISVFTSPGSPSAPPKPSTPTFGVSRHGHSSGGGTACCDNTSSAGGYTGGYATRHTLTQLSAASASGAAAAGDSPASRGSSGGRSMQASRRASVTDRPSAQQPHHHRTASHGIVDLSHSLASLSEKSEKPRGFYSKMLSYGRRAHTLPPAAGGQPQQLQHQQQTQHLPKESSVPELVLAGDDHPAASTVSAESSANKLAAPIQLAPPSPAAVAAALLGDAAAAAALIGMQESLASDAATAAAVAAITGSLCDGTTTGATAAAVADRHAAAVAVGECSEDGRSELSSQAGANLMHSSSKQLNTQAAARAVVTIFGTDNNGKDPPCDSNAGAAPEGLHGSNAGSSSSSSSIAVMVPATTGGSVAAEEEIIGSSKLDSKQSTPTERAKALARAALDVLQPHLRKSRKASEEPQLEGIENTTGLSKRQRRKMAVLLAAKKAEAEAAAPAAAAVPLKSAPVAQLTGSPWACAVPEEAASSATEHKLAATAITAGSVDSPAAASEQAALTAIRECQHEQKPGEIAPQRCSKQGTAASSPARSPQVTPRTTHKQKQMDSGIAAGQPASAAFSVGGDMQDTERAVSLKLAELGEYYRAPTEQGGVETSVVTAAMETYVTHDETPAEAAAAAEAAVSAAAEAPENGAAEYDLRHVTRCNATAFSNGGASGSVTISAAGMRDVTSSAGGAPGSLTSGADYRYSELIFRLQQFLPALNRADASNSDEFEATWDLIKVCAAGVQQQLDKQQQQQQLDEQQLQGQYSADPMDRLGAEVLSACMSELTGLVNTAKLAQLQTGKLEALDAEVAQLQKLLVRVGQHIKAGAQQQQLHDLVHTFPSFARRQVMEQTSGGGSSSGELPAAAAAAGAVGHASKPLAQTLAIALVNHSKHPHSSGGSSHRSNGLDTDGSTWSQGWSNASCGGSDMSMGNSSGGQSSGSSVRGSLMNGTISANRSSAGQQRVSNSSSAVRRSFGAMPGASEGGVGGGRGSASPPPPPHKLLTAEETEKLASLYKVAGDKPPRIFYKELKLAYHKTSGGGHSRYSDSGSPNTSPRCHYAAASPAATAGGAAAAASWRHVVSPEPLAATPAATEDTQQKEQQQMRTAEEEVADMHAVCSSSNPACDPLYAAGCTIAALTVNTVPYSTGHVYIGSGIPSSAARTAWSTGVTKGFRVLRAIPEAHKKPQSGSSQGGLSSPKSTRNGSPSMRHSRSHSTPPGMLASPESPVFGRGLPGTSPDRFASAAQSRDGTSPLRHSLAQTQFRERHHMQHQQPSELQAPVSWSYPRGRDARVRASREGGLALGLGTTHVSALPTPDPYMRARSTSPSIGMHYLQLERPSAGAGRGRGGAAPLRSSYCSIIGTGGSAAGSHSRGTGGPGGVASVTAGSPVKAAAAQVLAEDYRFSSARQAFMYHHSSAVAAEGLSSTKACGNDSLGGAKLAARLSPIKDADSKQIDAAIKRLIAILQDHNVNLELSRLGPCLYSAAGRKLRIRMLNGNLLVRTGGGHENLLDALGKLPMSACDGSSSACDALASGQHGSLGSSQHEELADDSCYANLAVEAAVAAAAVAAAADKSSSSCSDEQQCATVAAMEEVRAPDDAVAVVRIGEGSGVAFQCVGADGVACSGDAVWVAVAECAAEPDLKASEQITQQPTQSAVAANLAL